MVMTLAVPCLIYVSLIRPEITPTMLAFISMATAIAHFAVEIAGFAGFKVFTCHYGHFCQPSYVPILAKLACL